MAGGSRIPSEAKLVEQLGASRMTIHIALRDLSAEGVLLRRQGPARSSHRGGSSRRFWSCATSMPRSRAAAIATARTFCAWRF
ncbi:MAG: GntR family transcriptional regulator [Rhodobacter sp.]|nr:GntR family transcriptional regulator [Rhodobacter sp.]